MGRLLNTLERMDRVKVTTLLWVNAALAVFVALAHGGAIFIYHLGKAPEIADQIPNLYVSASTAIIGVLLSLLGLTVLASRTILLKIQTVLLLILALGMVYFAIDVIAAGPMTNVKFSWNPVLFAFVVAYPVYLARRTLLPVRSNSPAAFLFTPVWAAAGSVLLSALVLWRVWSAAT